MEASSSQGTSFRSISSVDRFTEDTGWMYMAESAKNGHNSIIVLSVHSTPGNGVELVHEGTFSAPMRDSKPTTEADEQADQKDRSKADNEACRQGATSQPEVKVANKGTLKVLTAECIQNWSETFVVDNGRQDFCSESSFVDTKQVLEEETDLVMSEHSIVQTGENLNYTSTETRKGHRSLTFASSKQTLEESSVKFERLQESAEVTSVLQHVQQLKLFRVKTFYDSTLLPEEGNKCFELVKSYGFVHEQQFALQDGWHEGAMYQMLCHVAMKQDKPVEGNTKGELSTMKAQFGKKMDFDFKVSLVEETIPSQRNLWNHWIGNGNSGMDAMAQANGIDKTQLRKVHHKQQKKRIWTVERISNMTQEMEEETQLNETEIQNDTVWLLDLRDQFISDKNANMFLKGHNSSKLEQRVLQWAGCTFQDNVDSV